MPVVAPSTKELIVLAGERLFALHGIDGVSMREIGAAAGNGNKSAVQYHFGSKDQLTQAIFEYRLPRLHERRSLLIRERDPDSLRGWVDCQVRAVLEQSELDGSHYMSFVAMLDEHGRHDVFDRIAPELRRAVSDLHQRIGTFVPHVPEPLRSWRIATAMALIVHVAARRERARSGSRSVLPFAVEVADLVDGMVGFLQAAVSPEARRAVGGAEPAAAWSSLL